MKRKDYADVPPIECGFDSECIWFILPVTAVSLNLYKKMHYGAISRYRSRYKAMFDLCMVHMIKERYVGVGENGVLLTKPVFDSVEVEWVPRFKTRLLRDNGNYVQKILMDAIVSTNFLKDDNHTIVVRETVAIDSDKYTCDSILCRFIGTYDKTMIIQEEQNELKCSIGDIREGTQTSPSQK